MRLVFPILAWLLAFAAFPSQGEEALRAGVTPGTPPFVVLDHDGALTGFTVELFRDVAARMKREIVFSSGTLPALIEALRAGTVDVLPGPISATPEDAAELLFTEGYVWSEFQFAGRPDAPVAAFADLRGRHLAVVAGSPYDEWADRNAEKYGFAIERVADVTGMVEAVVANRANASLAGSATQDFAARTRGGYLAGLSLAETRTHGSAAFRKSESELRAEAEEALGCLKQDGTVAKLAQKWVGTVPDAEDLENLVIPGYGVPGLAGYDPKPRQPHC